MQTLYDSYDDGGYSIHKYQDNLIHVYNSDLDIIQVYRNNELIFEREEKSPTQLEIEKIEKDMRYLADR